MENVFFKTPDRAFAFAFPGAPLDRVSERRDDAAFIAALRSRADARVTLIGREMPVLTRAAAARVDLPARDPRRARRRRIRGLARARAVGNAGFAARLNDDKVVQNADRSDGFLDQRELSIPGRDELELIDLRSIAVQGLVPPEALAMLGQAKAILDWHRRNRFCANCGAPTRVSAAGWRRECDVCKALHFPRTDPVVIMLALNGERCLLGRQRRFPKGMYSALAGFVEPGETIEEAVRREISEEASVRCGRVRYVASQPWPFPSSLMIGCLTLAESEEIRIDSNELEDARWFDRDELRAMFDKRHPGGLLAPNRMAIAHHLLRYWLDGEP